MGFHTHDDAGVYRLTDELALVCTADIITPPVDDPFVFGQIAAANALSDVYAMGGRPVVCVHLAGFPGDVLGEEVLGQIIAGSLDVVTEAGASLAGGHTTDDDEPKCGMAVTGTVHPDRIWTNAGAQVGDALVMTKAIGSGVLLNANLKGAVSEAAMERCIEGLRRLSRTAAEVLHRFEVHACTDVTGFGLAGHAQELARGSECTVRLDLLEVPQLDEAHAMYAAGVTTGVNAANRALLGDALRVEGDHDDALLELLVDPQTNGGLLAAVPEAQADALVAELRAAGWPDAARVGRVVAYDGARVVV